MSKRVIAVIGWAIVWGFSALPLRAESTSPQLMGRTMTAEEVQKAGLNKLSAEELAYLNAWLVGSPTVGVAPPSAVSAPAAADPDVTATSAAASPVTTTAEASDPFEKPKLPPRLVARVLPPFTGWEGRTVFRLDNGQVWRQRLPGRYVHQGGSEGPTEVVITRNMFGFFVLTVSSTGRGTGVERIQ
jgi:hypothetical protein